MKFIRVVLSILVLLAVAVFSLRWWMPLLTSPAAPLAVRNGRLSPCPDKPNCVSTQATRPEQLMSPLSYDGDTAVAQQQIVDILEQMPNNQIITHQQPGYIHAEFQTSFLRFIDDVEFIFDAENGEIHFRSASRLGYSDLGLNRERMNEIEQAFTAQ